MKCVLLINARANVGLITHGQPASDAFSKRLICFKSTDGSMNAWNRCHVSSRERRTQSRIRSDVYTSNRTVIDPYVDGCITGSWWTSRGALHRVPLNFYDFSEFPFFSFIESRFRIVPTRKGVDFFFFFEEARIFLFFRMERISDK